MHSLLRFVLLVLSLGLISQASAQMKLTGKILNAKNEPLPGVSIKLVGTNTGTSTDVEGR